MRKYDKGFALAGTMVALAVAMVALVITLSINSRYEKLKEINNAISMQTAQVSQFFRAVNQYVDENADGWTKDQLIPISDSTLISEGLLPANWNAETKFRTELAATASKIDDPANPGQTVNVFVVYETRPYPATEYRAMLAKLGLESEAEIEALKRRIGKAYLDKKMLGGYVKRGQSDMQGITNQYTKSLAGYITVDNEMPQVVAAKGFPDLAAYEPKTDGQNGTPGGPGIGGNTSHGSQSWPSPGYYTWTVPDGVHYVVVDAAAASGGDSVDSSRTPRQGGNGGHVRGGMVVTPGAIVKMSVGQKGEDGTLYNTPYSQPPRAGSGGGRTMLTIGDQVVFVIGGGAGAGFGEPNDAALPMPGGACGAPERVSGVLRRASDTPTGVGQIGMDGTRYTWTDTGSWTHIVFTGGAGGGADIASVLNGARGGRGNNNTTGILSFGGGGTGGVSSVFNRFGVGGGGGGGWYGGDGGAKNRIGNPPVYESASGGSGYCPGLTDIQESADNVGDGYVNLLW